MTCEKIREMIPAYQDGELAAGKAAMVRSHLESCQVCREEERLFAATWEMMGELKPIEPSPDFEARFWARVRRSESKQERGQWFAWRSLLPATVGLAGVAAIWLFGISGGLMLYHNQSDKKATSGFDVFKSPYPQNSIEKIFMNGLTTTGEEKNS